ncbi:MAG TPA: hypothetical protein PJ982_05110 [Lacipirellulaceae bacterium]|nr:hypothetical protein [Lacipirellulaceae bacterium]
MVRDRGGAPADVRAIIDYWRPRRRAWRSDGMLVDRLRHWAPGQPPDAGWPPPSAAWEADQQRRREAQQLERRRAEYATALARRDAEWRESHTQCEE